MKKANFHKIKKVFLRFAVSTIFILFLFCFLRFMVVGQFGVGNMMWGGFAGHAVHYLDENNINSLSGETKIVAEEILKRKRQLAFPCNLAPFKDKIIDSKPAIESEALCFGRYLMMSWLVVIKHQTGKEPLDTAEKNLEAWNYVRTLSPFYSDYYNVETDNILKDLSKSILKIEYKKYSNWVIGNIRRSARIPYWLIDNNKLHIIKPLVKNKTIAKFLALFASVFAAIVIITQYIIKKTLIDKEKLRYWNRQILVITLIALTLFIFGYTPVLLLNYPFKRLLVPMTFYLFPMLILWIIPPIWLKKSKTNHEVL